MVFRLAACPTAPWNLFALLCYSGSRTCAPSVGEIVGVQASLAQSVERFLRNEKVAGSIPAGGSTEAPPLPGAGPFAWPGRHPDRAAVHRLVRNSVPFHRNARAAQLPARLSRSWLLTSAANEDSFAPNYESEADSIILDLEDGTPAALKASARERVVHALNNGMRAWVRINAIDTEYWAEDLAALTGAKGLRGLVLAETEHPDHITRTAMMSRAGTPVIALIESAVGMVNAVDIAKAPGTFRLAFGAGDFRKDTGVADTPMAMAHARSTLVIASRVGHLPGPIDGPANGVSRKGLAEACQVTSEMGMTGKLTLDPGQTEAINKGLAPSEEEIAWAREMLDKSEHGDIPKDGSYLPRLARARKVSDLAQTYGMWGH